MCDVMRQLVKRGSALLTLADLLPGVDPSVSRHGTAICERLPTDVTHIQSLSGVYTAVDRQMTQLSKRLATVVTAMRTLSRVCSTMASHISLIVCGVLAPLTLVSPVPADVAVTQLHVFVQTILSQTRIIAVGTLNRSSAWGTPILPPGEHMGYGHQRAALNKLSQRAFSVFMTNYRRHSRYTYLDDFIHDKCQFTEAWGMFLETVMLSVH